MTTLVTAMSLLPSNGFSPSRQSSPRADAIPPRPIIARRLAAAGLLSTFVAGLRPAAAFENGVPEMADYRTKPKYPGTQPVLGLQGNGKLARCDYALNCFSTSGDETHLLKLWKPKAGSSNAMGELLETINAYPVGQARVDKGGWKIIQQEPSYVYVQFESLKRTQKEGPTLE